MAMEDPKGMNGLTGGPCATSQEALPGQCCIILCFLGKIDKITESAAQS